MPAPVGTPLPAPSPAPAPVPARVGTAGALPATAVGQLARCEVRPARRSGHACQPACGLRRRAQCFGGATPEDCCAPDVDPRVWAPCRAPDSGAAGSAADCVVGATCALASTVTAGGGSATSSAVVGTEVAAGLSRGAESASEAGAEAGGDSGTARCAGCASVVDSLSPAAAMALTISSDPSPPCNRSTPHHNAAPTAANANSAAMPIHRLRPRTRGGDASSRSGITAPPGTGATDATGGATTVTAVCRPDRVTRSDGARRVTGVRRRRSGRSADLARKTPTALE